MESNSRYMPPAGRVMAGVFVRSTCTRIELINAAACAEHHESYPTVELVMNGDS